MDVPNILMVLRYEFMNNVSLPPGTPYQVHLKPQLSPLINGVLPVVDSGSIFNFKASAKKEIKYVACSFLHGKQARWTGVGGGVPHGYRFHTEKVQNFVCLLRAFLPQPWLQ